jgi:hypothetical protein
MEWYQELLMEGIKTLPSAVLTLVTLGLGWVVGNQLTHYWAVRQKRRESQLAAAEQFQQVYGEFFAVWKLWRLHQKGEGPEGPTSPRWELLHRAAAAEAKLEAINIKLATECALNADDLHALGRFRQAVQQIRKAIHDRTKLPWTWSEQSDYLVFKEMACRVSGLLATIDPDSPPTPRQAYEALRLITTNWWETHWRSGEAPPPDYFAHLARVPEQGRESQQDSE